MAKDKTMYVCSECGQESTKWVGKCPACGQWNTMKEFRVKDLPHPSLKGRGTSSPLRGGLEGSAPQRLQDIQADAEVRIDMGDGELNRVLGGGLVQGSLVLLGGEPGIGKSTLILQTVLRMKDRKVLYVSGEESARQITLRADRLQNHPSPPRGEGVYSSGSNYSSPSGEAGRGVLILCETSLEAIYEHIEAEQPDIVVIDNIRDLVADINDGVKAQKLIEGLMHMAEQYNCNITTVIHQNRSSDNRGLRGWLGTELMNKVFEVFTCQKILQKQPQLALREASCLRLLQRLASVWRQLRFWRCLLYLPSKILLMKMAAVQKDPRRAPSRSI